MMNPLDYLPDQVKARLVDGGLTRLADAADRAGSMHLAKRLRALRSDTPFIEDVSAGLSRATEAFVRDWGERDPELTKLLADEVFSSLSPGFLEELPFDGSWSHAGEGRWSEPGRQGHPGGVQQPARKSARERPHHQS